MFLLFLQLFTICLLFLDSCWWCNRLILELGIGAKACVCFLKFLLFFTMFHIFLRIFTYFIVFIDFTFVLHLYSFLYCFCCCLLILSVFNSFSHIFTCLQLLQLFTVCLLFLVSCWWCNRLILELGIGVKTCFCFQHCLTFFPV